MKPASATCFLCLAKEHGFRECKKKRRCRTCRGHHHNLLHSDDYVLQQRQQQSMGGNRQRPPVSRPHTQPLQPTPQLQQQQAGMLQDKPGWRRGDFIPREQLGTEAVSVNAAGIDKNDYKHARMALPIVSVVVSSPGSNRLIKAYALLDTGVVTFVLYQGPGQEAGRPWEKRDSPAKHGREERKPHQYKLPEAVSI